MGNIPLWLCIPFAGLLLCIAIFPLVKENGGTKIKAGRYSSGHFIYYSVCSKIRRRRDCRNSSGMYSE